LPEQLVIKNGREPQFVKTPSEPAPAPAAVQGSGEGNDAVEQDERRGNG
jgi:hypothetical protein